MKNNLAPEPILCAALRVMYVASYTTRNWTLTEDVSRRQIYDLWEAIHEIPDLLRRWQSDADGLNELHMYLREYNEHWNSPDLKAVFDQALIDPNL